MRKKINLVGWITKVLEIIIYIFFLIKNYHYLRETGEIFLEICKDNKRDKPTLEEIILRRVRPGTHILTDCWGGYNGLKDKGKFYF